MKTTKSPGNTEEITPSKKKLTQARLPFKSISEVTTSPVVPNTRKRKLSVHDTESATKVGKLSKENDLSDDLVVISDDDSKDGQKTVPEAKQINPFVKLVDTARKKKLQKSKKKKGKNNVKSLPKSANEGCVSADTGELKETDDVEMMDVEFPSTGLSKHNNDDKSDAETKTQSDAAKESEGEIKSDSDVIKESVVIVLDEASNTSNKSSDSKSKEDSDLENTIDNVDKSKSDNVVKKMDVILLDKVSNTSDKKPSDSKLEEKDSDLVNTKNNVTENVNKSENESQSLSKDLTNSEKVDTESLTKNVSVKEENEPIEDKQILPITPKRSTRNKSKPEQNNNLNSSSSSKLNESVTSNPTTPKQNRSSSISKQDESLNESATSSNLTPKQLQKKLESAKKREEREKEKQDREKKRQQEKEERARQKMEKEEQRKKEREEKDETKRREKEEKEEQKKKERDERERQKELEKKLREEKEEIKRKEKEEKEEQRKKEKEAREEEKRKKQEALEQERIESEIKKKKAAEAFVNFFVPKQKSERDQPTVGPVSKNSILSSFRIKADMRLAPPTRVNLSTEKVNLLDKCIEEQNFSENGLYLERLKSGESKPLSSVRTWPQTDKDDDEVLIVEDELPPMDGADEILQCDAALREKLRPKLLSFHENRRPPYYGTWRKKSASIKPRKPFGQDSKHLDYEVDSDDDWEEEQEGESIDGSAAGSDDEQDADEYEVDNEVFVPHGYLSDEEATMDEDDVLSLSPETQKARLKHLEDEFESEMKKPTEKLKPRMYGLLWETSDGGKPEKCVDALWNYFGKMAMIMNDPTPFLQPLNEPEEAEKKKIKKKKATDEQKSPKSDKKKKPKPEEKEKKDVKPKADSKKTAADNKKNQPGINMFLTRVKTT